MFVGCVRDSGRGRDLEHEGRRRGRLLLLRQQRVLQQLLHRRTLPRDIRKTPECDDIGHASSDTLTQTKRNLLVLLLKECPCHSMICKAFLFNLLHLHPLSVISGDSLRVPVEADPDEVLGHVRDALEELLREVDLEVGCGDVAQRLLVSGNKGI